MSCETSYGRFLAAACTPNSPLTQHLGGGDPLVTRRVLEEVFSIAQERAARALTQRQPPDPRLRKPIHLLQQRGAGAAAREDCVRLFREIAAAGITPPAHGDPIDGETFALPKPAAIHAYAEVQRALDAAKRGEQTLLVNEVIAARAARAESAARSEAGKGAKVRAPTEEEYLRAWADENAWLFANDRPLVRIVADDLGPRLIFATGFGGDQEWAIYSVALGRKGRGGPAKPRGATLDGYTSAEGPLPDRPRRWGGDDDHGQWQRMASHLDHAMTKGAGSLRAAEIRTLTPHIEALARASDDLRASNEAVLPIIRPLIDRDQATCKRLLETGVEGLIRFTIAEAMIGHQNRNNPGADGAWDDDLDRQIAPLIRASFDAADRQAAADAALWEAMRPLAERSPDDIEALNRVVTITCGARFKLVQLKIDQAKPGGGPS